MTITFVVSNFWLPMCSVPVKLIKDTQYRVKHKI